MGISIERTPKKVQASLESEVVVDVVICGDRCTYTLASLGLVYMLGDYTENNEQKEMSFTPRIYNRKNVSSCTSVVKSYHDDVFTTRSDEFFTSGRNAWFGKLRRFAPFMPMLVKVLSG